VAEIICHHRRFSKLYKVVIREKEIQFFKEIESEKFKIEECKEFSKLFKTFFCQTWKQINYRIITVHSKYYNECR
jgi:hypothetical protein